jgi:hypothetical protein
VADPTSPSVRPANSREEARTAADPPVATVAVPTNAPAVLSCYTDAFTGKLRPVGAAGAPGSVPVFPCKQDAFTGEYRR